MDQQLLTSSILPTEQETLNSPLFSSSIQQSNNSDCSVAPASSPSSSSSLVYSQEVDEIVNLTNLLYQPAEVPCNNSSEVAEIAFDLLSSLPSSPSLSHSSSGVPSPSTMQFPPRYHYEPLPSIDTLSTDSLDSPHLAPIKKPFSFIPQQQSQPLSLPSFSPLPFRSHLQTPPHHSIPIPSIPSPQSPPSSPSHSPKRNKKNYTKEFNTRFHELLNHNEDAANQWHLYAQKYKARCTIKRSPCIKVSRGFCASYGSEFNELAKEERYGALGTRTECECGHKAAPLILPSSSSSIPAASSSSSPSSPAQRKQRTTVRPSPYPTSSHSRANPSTPQEIELPDSPQQDQPTPVCVFVSSLLLLITFPRFSLSFSVRYIFFFCLFY